jgi:hypothetical protein
MGMTDVAAAVGCLIVVLLNGGLPRVRRIDASESLMPGYLRVNDFQVTSVTYVTRIVHATHSPSGYRWKRGCNCRNGY